MAQGNVQIVRDLFEQFQAGMERGDPSSWFDSEHVADDAEWIPAPATPGVVPSYRGRKGFLDFMGDWTEDFEVVGRVGAADRRRR
jgi:hypothetical protein